MANSLSKNILSGAIWTSFQTIGTKLFSMFGQLILAWILLPDDFGKIGLAYTITSFGTLMQNFGMSEVLISRGKSFDVLLPLAKSVSLVTAVGCMVLMVILGVFGGLMYNDFEITYLVLIFSLSIPFNTLSVVPETSLRRMLKFKSLSILQVYTVFFTQLLTIVFAFLSFGVYSFVLPVVLVSLCRYLYLNYLSGISVLFTISFRRWKHLVTNSTWGFIHALCQRVIQQFDFVVLGLFTLQSEVGIYYLAFSLSVQAIGFLVGSIAPILLPTLVKIPKEESGKIKDVLLKITSLFALLGMPFAFWQAVSAKPLIVMFLSDKWLNCIPLIQILSLGIGFKVVSSLWEVALQLKSKFKRQAYFSIWSSLYFVLLIVPLSYFYKSTGAAIAVALFHITSSPLLVYMSYKNYGITFQEVAKPLSKYFLLSFAVFGIVYYCSLNFDSIYISLLLNVILSPVIYASIIFILDRDIIMDLWNKFRKRG